MQRLFSLAVFATAVAAAVALAATPEKGRLGASKVPAFINDGGWQEFGMVGLLTTDGGPFVALDMDGGWGAFSGVIGHGLGEGGKGSLTKEQIKRVITAHVREVSACYEALMLRTPKGNPQPRGKVTLRFVINAEGRVPTADVKPDTLDDATFNDCLSQRAKTWIFPRPAGNGSVTVNYPFTLKPAEPEPAPASK